MSYVCSASTNILNDFLIIFHIVHQRFLYSHGQETACLTRSQYIHPCESRQRTLFLMFLSPILFSAPGIHLKSIEKVWVDNTINQVSWNNFLDDLNADWELLLLYVSWCPYVSFAKRLISFRRLPLS